ncbi:hypothetical protein [Priestia megaterium]|uniref:hypothetical protein n=1 Tax=Priestia megaterium TaxID=1404 RepID=UPI002854E3A5|nr:hypothetical protein [Priestia megaterium]MDR7207958.1 hypothetical protein [Priestia megaterium]
MNNLQVMVNDFLKNYSDCQLKELNFYTEFKTNPKKLIHLIAWAKTSDGKTHSHQCRIPKNAKQNLENYLLANYEKLSKMRDFEDLMRGLRGIKGIGTLTCYDVATRLGICFGVTPQKVYLHRGTYKGAKNLLGDTKVRGKSFLNLIDFPKELQCLTPSQIEDFLCIYRNSILNMNFSPKKCTRGAATVRKAC